MKCKYCNEEFKPNKYHPGQKVCFASDCQRLRQIMNEKDWRLKNPDYFKCLEQDVVWRNNRHRYNKLWKLAHQDYLKEYEQSHQLLRKEYMREYMRRYRSKV